MNRINTKVISLISIIVIISSCMRDNFDFDKLSTKVQNRSTWSLPVAYGSLTIDELVKMTDSITNNNLVQNDSNLVILRFQDTMISKTSQEIITLQNQAFVMQFNKTDFDAVGGFSNGSSVMTKHETEYPFGVMATQLLDSIILDNSNLRIRVHSNTPFRGQLTITFPDLSKNGISYVRTINLQPQSGTFVYDNVFQDLKGYKLDLTKASQGVNSLFINYTLLLYDDNTHSFDENNRIEIQVDFEENRYEWLFGYAGVFESEIGPSDVSLAFFNKAYSGGLYIERPQVRFKITNSFGFPTLCGFDYAHVYNKRLNKTDSIIGIPYYSTNPILLPLPPLSYPSPIEEITEVIEVVGEVSNLSQLIYELPQSLEYKVKINLNPPTITNTYNYISKASKTVVVSQVDLPFWGRTTHLGFIDTTKFDGSELQSVKYINKAKLRLDIANGFPHDIRVQCVMIDKNNQPIDSLFTTDEEQIVVKSGIVEDGRVNQKTGRTKHSKIIEVNKAKVEKIKNADKVAFIITYNTTLPSGGQPQQSVLFFRDYGVDIAINLEAELEIDEHL